MKHVSIIDIPVPEARAQRIFRRFLCGLIWLMVAVVAALMIYQLATSGNAA